MKRFVLACLSVLFGLAAVAVGLIAVLAFLGFAEPRLDLINHGQVLLFPATALALLLTPLFVQKRPWNGLVLAAVATGFLASSVTVIPEFVSSIASRDPLPMDGRRVYRLMSHNVWTGNRDMEAVAAQVLSIDPDILLLQEYQERQQEGLHDLIVGRYPYWTTCRGYGDTLGVYAKLPFAPGQEECSGADQRAPRQSVRFVGEDGTLFTVISTHLEWPVPIGRQSAQFSTLAETIRGLGGPVLLAGDFNSTPWSYALRGFVADAGLTRHTRNLTTFPSLRRAGGQTQGALPLLPIDHLMTAGMVEVHAAFSGRATGSDHLPVVADFSIVGPAIP